MIENLNKEELENYLDSETERFEKEIKKIEHVYNNIYKEKMIFNLKNPNIITEKLFKNHN